MTPEEMNNALQSGALTYVREVKQQDVPLRVNQELAGRRDDRSSGL